MLALTAVAWSHFTWEFWGGVRRALPSKGWHHGGTLGTQESCLNHNFQSRFSKRYLVAFQLELLQAIRDAETSLCVSRFVSQESLGGNISSCARTMLYAANAHMFE